MADRKITDLTALAAGSQATGDLVTVVDVSEAAAADKNKKMTMENLFKGIPGNVGIGTTSPNSTLHVAGNLTITKSSNNPAIVFDEHSGSTDPKAQIQMDQTNSTNASLLFSTEGSGTLSERMRIDSSGRLLVGHSSSRTVDAQMVVQIEGTTQQGSSMSLVRNSNDAAPPNIVFGKSRGTSTGSNTVVQSGDDLGIIQFFGADGTDANSSAASIKAEVDGTPGSNDMPGRLVLATTADGASSPTERLRIDSSGRVGIGTTSPSDYDLGADDLVVANSGNGGVSIITGTSSVGALYFGDGTSSNQPYRGRVEYKHAEDSLNFGSAGTLHATLDSSGRLILGTFTAPSVGSTQFKLSISGEDFAGSGKAQVRYQSATAGPSMLFAKARGTTASPSIVDNGDQLGKIRFYGYDGSDFASLGAEIAANVDGNPGNNDMPGRLTFSTTADGGTSPQERMRIDKDGKLFVKNSFSDSARNVVIQIECSGQGRGRILSGNSDTDPATLGASSDRRLKTNIRNYTGGLERIRQIPVKIYDEVNTSATDVISWVADEVAPIFPEAVIGEANAVDADGNPEYQILSSLKFFPDLVQCVQTLIAKVETLETQNTAQQAQIDDLLARVTALEAA
jgi:hypothetical protein